MRWEWREKEGGIEGRGRERHGGRWREQRGLDKKRENKPHFQLCKFSIVYCSRV